MTDPWAARLVDPGSELRGLPRRASPGDLLAAFHDWQAARWPRLADALASMEAIRTRELWLDGRKLVLQWNPGRVASTTARIESDALAARPCFLCPAQLPGEEAAVAWGERLVWLANPAPIAPLHLVVADRQHRPQALLPVLREAIELAVGTGDRLTVFYNGPRCGASAPDHLHLQAIARGSTPDERTVTCRAAGCGRDPLGRVLVQRPGLHAWSDRGSSRTLVVMRGTADGVEQGLRVAYDALADSHPDDDEPPLNLLLSADGPLVTALLYPRGAHRPACYHADGDAQRLVSPGALDMAGLVITVRREDFERLDEAALATIFEETSLDGPRADDLEDALIERLADGTTAD